MARKQNTREVGEEKKRFQAGEHAKKVDKEATTGNDGKDGKDKKDAPINPELIEDPLMFETAEVAQQRAKKGDKKKGGAAAFGWDGTNLLLLFIFHSTIQPSNLFMSLSISILIAAHALRNVICGITIVFNQDTLFRAYKNRLKHVQPNADKDKIFRDANSLDYASVLLLLHSFLLIFSCHCRIIM
jgi:hypothetical protein